MKLSARNVLVGDKAAAIIKASDVMVGKQTGASGICKCSMPMQFDA